MPFSPIHEGRTGSGAPVSDAQLNPWTGEFLSKGEERSYRVACAPEVARQARLLFLLTVALNAVFLVADWQLAVPDLGYSIGCRLAMATVALAGVAALSVRRDLQAVEGLLIAWQWLTALGAALLMRPGTDISLFVVIALPTIYYLAVPVPFRWCVINGAGASLLLLAAATGLPPVGGRGLGLLISVLALNVGLALAAQRANRQARLAAAAVAAERQARDTLVQSQHLLEHTFMAVPIPLLITEIESGRILRYNEAGVRYFGGDPEAFGITTVDQVYADPRVRRAFLERLSKNGRVTNFETKIRLAHGEIRTVLLAAAFTEVEGRACLISGVVDITDRLAAEQKIRFAATHDSLTGLMNRSAFLGQLETVLSQVGGKAGGVALLMVDLDGLKDVNDTLGHDAGDMLLVETARRLERLTKDVGRVARLGGDEFVVVLPSQPSVQPAMDLAGAILSEFRLPLALGERHMTSRASIGIALSPAPGYAAGELMKDADLALYAAKAQGRNRVVSYSPAMRRAMNERILLSRELTRAVANGLIVPYYQPKFSLATGRLVGLEALMRWQQGPGLVAGPDRFAAAFEDAELALAMGDAILQAIAVDARNWLSQGLSFGRIAFNLAPAQFTQPRLAGQLLAILAREGVEPSHFDLEVTETVVMGKDADFVAPILDELYAAGMRIALDDFGTGYAALTHLKQFPIDALKIDRSFVADIETDAFDAAIVCAVIELGRNLGLRVIAEGVETVGQARFLKDRGCEYAQGYLYARPMPAAMFADFLLAERQGRASERLARLGP